MKLSLKSFFSVGIAVISVSVFLCLIFMCWKITTQPKINDRKTIEQCTSVSLPQSLKIDHFVREEIQYGRYVFFASSTMKKEDYSKLTDQLSMRFWRECDASQFTPTYNFDSSFDINNSIGLYKRVYPAYGNCNEVSYILINPGKTANKYNIYFWYDSCIPE